MGITPSDISVLVTGAPIKNQNTIKNLAGVLLDDIGFKSFALINSCSLSLFSTGRTSGIVLESGESKTFTVPIFEVNCS
jgi:actin-related protein